MEGVPGHPFLREGPEEHIKDRGGEPELMVGCDDVVADGEGAVVVGAVEGEEGAKERRRFGEHAGAGEDVEEEGVGAGVGAVVLGGGGEAEEGEAGGGVEAEAEEDGVGEVVGELEGEAEEGVGAVEDEEAGDSVEEFGFG